ncbi:hypothetical protein ACN47E_005989 [Coniothyrium glycines]
MTDITAVNSDITPEKLTILKLKSGFARDVLSEPSSPSGYQSFNTGRASRRSSFAARSSRQVSGSSRRASTFLQSHRSKMSSELTSQAEGKFFALLDLMATASREASSLKEAWVRIIADRDALMRERDDLVVNIEEITETLERKESEYDHHGHEHGERQKQVQTLLLELSTALTSVTAYKKRIADKDREIETFRTELDQLRTSSTNSSTEHDRIRTELDSAYNRLRAVEEERESFRNESEKYHGELRTLQREHTDLKSRHEEDYIKIESTRKELITLTDRTKLFELERDEYLHEKDRISEDLKRHKLRSEESYREFTDLTERHDRLQRDHHKVKEVIRAIETERDDHSLTIESLRREIKAKLTIIEESDSRFNDINLKHEHTKREIVSVKEKLRDIELERSELRDRIERSREEHRVIVIERDQLREDAHDDQRKIEDSHRRIHVLEESLRRAEFNVSEVKSQINILEERNKVFLKEGEGHRNKHGIHEREISELQEKIVVFQAQIRDLTGARDRAHSDLEAWKHKYEEVTETITSFDDSSAEFEFEIQSLRTLLREAREQKERAISARHHADRERDEATAKYEEKCRELERFEESASSMYHSQHKSSGGGGRSTTTRTVSSGTTIHNSGHGHSSGHSHEHHGSSHFDH